MLTLKNASKMNRRPNLWRWTRSICIGLMALLIAGTAPAISAELPEDAPEEIRAQLAAAHERDVGAMYKVALYLMEQSVTDDDQMAKYAFGWALLAARNGHPQAAELTGVMYRRGVGVPQNFVKARKWLERALARKSPEPNFELALLYADDSNPGVNKRKAATYLGEAISMGEPRACLISARNKLASGLEFRKVLKQVTCAAEGGLVDAMEMLGDYNLGQKSPYAAVRGREWLERAAAAGSISANEKLLQLDVD